MKSFNNRRRRRNLRGTVSRGSQADGLFRNNILTFEKDAASLLTKGGHLTGKDLSNLSDNILRYLTTLDRIHPESVKTVKSELSSRKSQK